jgi:hypothetical protein
MSPALPEEAQLEAWAASCREPAGRERLLGDGTIASAATSLEAAADAWRASGDPSSSSSHAQDDDEQRPEARRLLLLQRLLRNACAAGAPAADALL